MTFTQFGSIPRSLFRPMPLRALITAALLAAVLSFPPAHAAALRAAQPASGLQGSEGLHELASSPLWADPGLPQRGPLLAARGSFSDSGRPARQMRVGGAGGGYHGPSRDGLPFTPEVPGQSIQQSIGQTLAQPPKPTPAKTPKAPGNKVPGKQPQKPSVSAKGKQPSQPAKKTQAPPSQSKPAPQHKPTVYIITMDDGQVIKGTMKPAGGSYIVSTRNGPLTIRKKNIVKLAKATP